MTLSLDISTGKQLFVQSDKIQHGNLSGERHVSRAHPNGGLQSSQFLNPDYVHIVCSRTTKVSKKVYKVGEACF